MLGCKSSIAPLNAVAVSYKCKTHVEELKQGRTSRWVFCWSYIDNFFSEKLEIHSDKNYLQVLNHLRSNELKVEMQVNFPDKKIFTIENAIKNSIFITCTFHPDKKLYSFYFDKSKAFLGNSYEIFKFLKSII